MDSHPPQIINLEVTVPRIVLSTNRKRPGPMGAVLVNEQAGQRSEIEEEEQVRLLPFGGQEDSLTHQRTVQQQSIAGEARMMHSLRFRLFRISITVPGRGQSFLFQVLRKYSRYAGEKLRKRSNAKEEKEHTQQLHVTDALAFSVAFRRLEEPAEAPSVAITSSLPFSSLIPGLNQVIIYVDSEGTPASYSIDGAES